MASLNNVKFIIISNDTGYDAVVTYWKEKGKNISRKNIRNSERKKVKKCKSDTYESVVTELSQTVSVNKKSEFYTALIHLYGEEKGKAMYEAVKKMNHTDKNNLINNFLTDREERRRKYSGLAAHSLGYGKKLAQIIAETSKKELTETEMAAECLEKLKKVQDESKKKKALPTVKKLKIHMRILKKI